MPQLSPKKAMVLMATTAMVAAATAACSDQPAPATGGGAGGTTGSSLPASVKILSIRQLTGPSSFAGTNGKKGMDLALDEIAAQQYLGSTTLQVDVKDSANSVQEAASFATQGVADKSYSAIIGPEASGQATAVSAIVQPAKMPTIYIQAGSTGVVTGDYTFRVTAPAATYFDISGKYLKTKAVANAAVLYATDNPTLTQLGTKTVPEMAPANGFAISSSDGVASNAQDFSAFASKVTSTKPQAVFVMLIGPQTPVVITQLRRAGYTGEVVGMSAMGSGNLKPAGDLAKGAVWPTDFSADQTATSSQKFVAAYKAKYSNEAPNNYAAEGYDAMWFLARGIKAAGSADRTAIQGALAGVAKSGFDGAMGKLTFDGNDLRVTGVLATWNGTGETVVPSAG